MPLDTGAHAALMAPDQTALDYLKAKSVKDPEPILPDGDAQYYETASYDIAELEPYVSPPPSPATARPISQATGVRIDQAYIGSCSGGRLTDLRIAADILRGRKVHPDTRMIVTPITQATYKEAVKEGIIETLIEANVVIGPPGCGACPGAHMGAMGAEETVISTTSMNYPGRMGDPAAKIYLASAYTVAASAAKGEITDPREFLS
jgi:homoaconitase/3-isopropylmalate dehydratase large subunit